MAVIKLMFLAVSSFMLLAGILMILFSFLAPVSMLHSQLAFLTVMPSTDGPSIFLGALGSCSRTNNDASVVCTPAALSPAYDLSALPSNTPDQLLSTPIMGTPFAIVFALSITIVFFFTYTAIAFGDKLSPAVQGRLAKPFIRHTSIWMGVISFIIGAATFLVLRIWFGKSVLDFNNIARAQGSQLVAELGNAFTLTYVAYGLITVPLVVSLVSLQPPKK